MMTDPRKILDEAVEAGAKAMARSKAWPVVFEAGSAELLSRAAILAALPVIGEAMAKIVDEKVMAAVMVNAPPHIQVAIDVASNRASDIAAAQRAFIERMMG